MKTLNNKPITKARLLKLFREYLLVLRINKRVKVRFARLPKRLTGRIREAKWDERMFDNLSYVIEIEANLGKFNSTSGSIRYIFYKEEQYVEKWIATFFHELGHYFHKDIMFHSWERDDYYQTVKELCDVFEQSDYPFVKDWLIKAYNQDRKNLWAENSHKKDAPFRDAEDRADLYAKEHQHEFYNHFLIN